MNRPGFDGGLVWFLQAAVGLRAVTVVGFELGRRGVVEFGVEALLVEP